MTIGGAATVNPLPAVRRVISVQCSEMATLLFVHFQVRYMPDSVSMRVALFGMP